MRRSVTSMKEIMPHIVHVVCSYLRVDEDLFFTTRGQIRIIEAKKYFSYFAYKKFGIPPSQISSYLGVSEKRSSITIDRANSVQSALFYDKCAQTSIDIENIGKILMPAVNTERQINAGEPPAHQVTINVMN